MLWKLCFVALAAAQSTTNSSTSTTTSIFNQDVPTGTPVPGDYAGALRPQVHFSPPKGFMNDPNGCFVDANGTWHLYYQCRPSASLKQQSWFKLDNPTADIAGNQHWGHATSQDLYTWENQQIALFPTESSQIFSGSVVIDVNNTSGFFPNQTNGVVAIYTLNTRYEQTQDIAYSYDGGYSFEKYAQNPVLAVGSSQFRDPKVVWYEDHWVMVIAYVSWISFDKYKSDILASHKSLSLGYSHHRISKLGHMLRTLVIMVYLVCNTSVRTLLKCRWKVRTKQCGWWPSPSIQVHHWAAQSWNTFQVRSTEHISKLSTVQQESPTLQRIIMQDNSSMVFQGINLKSS